MDDACDTFPNVMWHLMKRHIIDVCQRLCITALIIFSLWLSLWSYERASLSPLWGQFEALDADLGHDDASQDHHNLPHEPGEAMNEPGLTPEQAKDLSEIYLEKTLIGALVLFGSLYFLFIK